MKIGGLKNKELQILLFGCKLPKDKKKERKREEKREKNASPKRLMIMLVDVKRISLQISIRTRLHANMIQDFKLRK